MSFLKYLSVLKEDPILIKRFFETVMTKFGFPFYKIPKVVFNPKSTTLIPCEIRSVGTFRANDNEKAIAECFLGHRFAVLGDKWTLYSKKQNDGYEEIDWQFDYKSAYSFEKNMLSSECLKNIPKGVDIKTPWELSRLQHLPFLARLALTGDLPYNRVRDEYVNEISDFINNNKMGYGVNWACSMDVAIRAVNILLAYDMLFGQVVFERSFEEKLTKSLFEHGLYIYNNLEKNFTEDKSGNHYLSDLCGLIIISSHLKCKKAKKWFEFACEEFLKEIDKQFFSDGGNYEFSTAYQRLDCEILALTVAFLIRNGKNIPELISKKLYASYEFLVACTYSDGEIIQIGDNDSGHLFRLGYSCELNNIIPSINELDANAAILAMKALFFEDKTTPESCMVCEIIDSKQIQIILDERSYKNEISERDFNYRSQRKLILPQDGKVETHLFSDFGLYVFQKGGFKLFFRLPADIRRGKPLHIHSDFLHYEYELDGAKYYRDRGSFSYSGDEEERNLFRSAAFHNVPIYEAEQNIFSGVWGITPKACGEWVVYENCLIAELTIGDVVHRRSVSFKDDELTITDESNCRFEQGYIRSNVFSAGYGIKYSDE